MHDNGFFFWEPLDDGWRQIPESNFLCASPQICSSSPCSVPPSSSQIPLPIYYFESGLERNIIGRWSLAEAEKETCACQSEREDGISLYFFSTGFKEVLLHTVIMHSGLGRIRGPWESWLSSARTEGNEKSGLTRKRPRRWRPWEVRHKHIYQRL